MTVFICVKTYFAFNNIKYLVLKNSFPFHSIRSISTCESVRPERPMKDPDGYMIPCEHFPLRPLSRFSLFRISQITLSACFWFLNKVGCNWTPPRHRTLVTSFTDSCRGLPAASSQGWSFRFRGTINLIHKSRGCVIKIRQGKAVIRNILAASRQNLLFFMPLCQFVRTFTPARSSSQPLGTVPCYGNWNQYTNS